MSDERLRLELEELERWYRSHSCPSLDRESLSVLKLTVAGALGERWHEADDAGPSPEDFRRRIQRAVRGELASARVVAGGWKNLWVERGSELLSSAAALVFVVACYGLMGGNLEQPSALQPMEWVSAIGSELTDIEQALAAMELRSDATELVFFSSQEIDLELRATLEAILFTGLEWYPDDEPNQEGMVQ